MKKKKKRAYKQRPKNKEKISVTVDKGTVDKIKELDESLSNFVNEGIKRMLMGFAGK